MGEMISVVIIVALMLLSAYLVLMVLSGYYIISGLLYYLITEYSDDISHEKVQNLAREAMKHHKRGDLK